MRRLLGNLCVAFLVVSSMVPAEDLAGTRQEALKHFNQRSYEKSLELFKRCIDLDSNNSGYWKYAGLCLEQLGRYEEAVEHFAEAKRLSPDDHNFHMRCGLLYHVRLNRPADALPCYVTAVEIMGRKGVRTPAWLLYNTGLVHAGLSEPDWIGAERYLEQAVGIANDGESKYRELAEKLLVSVLRKQEKLHKLFDFATRHATTPEVRRLFMPENLGVELYKAVARDDAAYVRFLLEKGAPTDFRHERSRDTALHVAVHRNNPEIVQVLIDNGADLFVRNARGMSAYAVGSQNRHSECMAHFDKSRYQHHYQGYLTIFPIGGLDGIDYYSASCFDNNPEPTLPLTIPTELANRIVHSGIPEDKRALFNRYYQPDADVYRLTGLENQVQLETVWVTRILLDWGGVDSSILRTDTAIDYMGNQRTYDNHIGHDYTLLNYQMQDFGVPVYAAANGTAFVVRKGHPDREVRAGQVRGDNTVYIDHGYDRVTYYNHLRSDVLVDVGDYVYAGQQIAWVGASTLPTSGKALEVGSTPIPHLHFSAIEWGEWLEPYEGPYHQEPSRWREQPPYRQQLRLLDFGISKRNEFAGPPLVTKKRNCFPLTETEMVLWFLYYFLEPKTALRYRIISPSGDEVYADTVLLSGEYWNRYTVNLNAIGLHAGTWTASIEKNDVPWFECPFTVVESSEDIPSNRAPLSPVSPRMSRIDSESHSIYKTAVEFPRKYLDPDLDRVRYRYVWQINGGTVRDVTMASHFDYLPVPGIDDAAVVECSVYAYDGQVYSPSATAAHR